MARKTKLGEKVKSRERDLEPETSRVNLKSTISIVGAGRLGTALAIALSVKGYTIEAVVNRRISDARRAARVISPRTQSLSLSHLSDLPPSNIILITTPDDAIRSVADQLAVSVKSVRRGRVALHASGALSSEELIKLRAAGYYTGSMHPLISVSDSQTGARSFRHAHFCVEGQPQAVRIARGLLRKLGGKSFSIATQDKALYHAAAVMTSGHVVALFDIATEMLVRCGLSERDAREIQLPLLASTVENLTRNPPSKALTGTFGRADASTVVKHLAALRGLGMSDALATYTLLGIRSLALAQEKGAARATIRKIKRILEEANKEAGG